MSVFSCYSEIDAKLPCDNDFINFLTKEVSFTRPKAIKGSVNSSKSSFPDPFSSHTVKSSFENSTLDYDLRNNSRFPLLFYLNHFSVIL